MSKTNQATRDNRYLDVILQPIRVSAAYKPKMGYSSKVGLSLDDFRQVYGSDSFYSWFGLDNPLMYAAHKAAGGMTSIYRQIGIGCEALFRLVLQDELGLNEDDSSWSYSVSSANKKTRTLSLDGRIPLDSVRDAHKRNVVRKWIRRVAKDLAIDPKVTRSLRGVVFEVRQGYKSKDSKRQNADIANAVTAYTQAYLPCVLLMSTQIDSDILNRYQAEKWVVLAGYVGKSDTHHSTYDFLREVIGYDLSAFFERHADTLRAEVERVLEALLSAE